MNIDWQKEVDRRKEELLKDLQEILQINSERDDLKATKEAPFGPGPVAGLKKMLAFGERDGFAVKNVDNYAGHIDYGQGEETLGIFCHMDVVPAGEGWATAPYKPVVTDEKIFARGASDDKGPSIAAYYGLKIIKDLGVPLTKKVRFVVGSDEESGWADMDYYFQHEKKPDFGFSPDAEFPIINGEKGNVSFYTHFPTTSEGTYELQEFSAGLRENMVPDTAIARIIVPTVVLVEKMKGAFTVFIQEEPVSGTFEASGQNVMIKMAGKGAHGASPQAGINAATYLALFLKSYDFQGAAQTFLQIAGTVLHEDFYGEKTGVAFEDETMGRLTMNAGLFVFRKDNPLDNYITLNFRYPKGITAKMLETKLTKMLEGKAVTISIGERVQEPHYVPVTDPLVETLLAVYEKHTGQKGQEKVIGGGTYGRLLTRGVAYGAMFPGYTDTMHQANEFMALDDLFRATAIYAEAIYELTK